MKITDIDAARARLFSDHLRLARGRTSDAEETRSFALDLLAGLAKEVESPAVHALASLARANVAAVQAALGDIRAALATVAKAEEEAELGGDSIVQAKVYLSTASLFARAGEFTLGRRWFLRTLALPDLPAEEALLARSNMAGMLRAAGRLEQASAEYDALADELTAHGDAVAGTRRAVILINMASCWSQVGRLDDAESALCDAERAMGADERPDLWAWVDTIRSWVRFRDERYSDAIELADRVATSEEELPLALRGSAAAAGANAAAELDSPSKHEIIAGRLQTLIDESSAAGIRATKLLLSEGFAAIREAQGDLHGAVQHLREAQRLREALRQDEAVVLQRQEELQIEVVRMQLENTYLRGHQDELREANRELQRLDEERVRLTRTIVHDMRNLLNVVKLGVSGIDATDPEFIGIERESVLVACDRMEALMMAELGGDAPSSERLPLVGLRALVDDAASVFGVLAASKSQRFVVEGDEVKVRIDATTFGRVIDNLLTNAIKYSPVGGLIELRVHRTGHGVEVSVADRGPGFPDIERGAGLLYGTQFATEGTSGEDGFGIGLHTAYTSAVSLGGTLRIANRADGGTCVRVLLPVGQPCAAASTV